MRDDVSSQPKTSNIFESALRSSAFKENLDNQVQKGSTIASFHDAPSAQYLGFRHIFQNQKLCDSSLCEINIISHELTLSEYSYFFLLNFVEHTFYTLAYRLNL